MVEVEAMGEAMATVNMVSRYDDCMHFHKTNPMSRPMTSLLTSSMFDRMTYQNCDARTVSHSCDASFQVCSALDAMIGSDSAPDIVLDLTTAGEHRLIFFLLSSQAYHQ